MQANFTQPGAFQQNPGMRPGIAQVFGCRPPSASKFDQATVIRMGNQISSLLVDSALPASVETVHTLIQKCVALGVSTPRGVQLVMQANCGTDYTNTERVELLAEAVSWEMASELKLSVTKEEVTARAKCIANAIGDVTVDDVILDMILNPGNVGKAQVQPELPSKIGILELEENYYRSVRNDEEFIISREYGIHPKSGEPMYGQWVLRNFRTGEFIDSDRYLNDITERNHFNILR